MENERVPRPVFPVLSISRKGIVEYHRSMSDINAPIYSLYKRGHYVGIRFFDSEGCEYGVLGSRVLSGPIARIFGLGFRVEVDLGMIGRHSVDAIRSALARAIEEDADFWEAGEDIVSLKGRLESFTSTRDMIGTLCEEYFKEHR